MNHLLLLYVILGILLGVLLRTLGISPEDWQLWVITAIWAIPCMISLEQREAAKHD